MRRDVQAGVKSDTQADVQAHVRADAHESRFLDRLVAQRSLGAELEHSGRAMHMHLRHLFIGLLVGAGRIDLDDS